MPAGKALRSMLLVRSDKTTLPVMLMRFTRCRFGMCIVRRLDSKWSEPCAKLWAIVMPSVVAELELVMVSLDEFVAELLEGFASELLGI